MKQKSRSKQYQYKIVEISFEQNKLSNFSSDRGISHILAENEADEKIVELRHDLLEELSSIINGGFLTSHQKRILEMRLLGQTQNEIADQLGITQSAVHKAMHGNIDYKNAKKRYGGIIKKLKKICKNNHKIQTILSEIRETKNNEKDSVDMLLSFDNL